MTDTEGRRLPRRLWPEMTRPTAEEFATWSRGVFLDQLVPVLERLFEAAERGEWCLIGDHASAVILRVLDVLEEPDDVQEWESEDGSVRRVSVVDVARIRAAINGRPQSAPLSDDEAAARVGEWMREHRKGNLTENLVAGLRDGSLARLLDPEATS